MTMPAIPFQSALRQDEIGQFAILRINAKRSRGRRYRAAVPRLPALDALLAELMCRYRRPGVETVLLNSYGKAWSSDGLNSSFHDARARAYLGAGIWHSERDPLTGEETRFAKRLHDFRGTFATMLMTHPTARLTDKELGEIMGWSESQIGEIRQRYVDDAAIVVALTKRLAASQV